MQQQFSLSYSYLDTDLLGCVTIPLPNLAQDQPGPRVMEGRLPLLNREQSIIGTIALNAEIGWETKM